MFRIILLSLVFFISSCAGVASNKTKKSSASGINAIDSRSAASFDDSKEVSYYEHSPAPGFNKPHIGASLSINKPLEKFSMGSCNRSNLPQPLWPVISSHNPDLFLWLGDNVYLDTEDTEVMKSIYEEQLANAGYAKLINQTPVIGIWDDHDYGVNDGGKDFPKKIESQKLFLDFMNEPSDSPRREQEGIYATYTYGPKGRQVRFILLDVRYHRDEPNKKNSDILGEKQWEWLDKVLKHNEAQATFIVSGISVLSLKIPTSEEWARFKKSRSKLFDMVQEYKTKGVMILTGDRHFSGTYQNKIKGRVYHELMSSGMTHTVKTKFAELVYSIYYGPHNRVIEKSFANIEINWNASPIELSFKAKNVDNKTIFKRKYKLNKYKGWQIKKLSI